MSRILDPAPMRPAPPRGGRRRGLRRAAAVLTLLLLGSCAARSSAEHLPLAWQVRLGIETAQPTRPTVYADGHYAFLARQPYDPDRPLGYNPCRKILVLVNLRGAPPDGMELVLTAMRHVHQASGLTFAYAGQSPDRPSYSVGRTGPVLVSWTDQDEMTEMGGSVLGMGGSGSYAGQPGETTYLVSGLVTLSATQFARLDRSHRQAVMDHEFGHLVGLAHVDDTGEIMNPYVTGRSTFGHGDLTGLARLGQLACR